MTVQIIGDEEDCAFSKQLWKVGNGTLVGEQEYWVSSPFGYMLPDLKELMIRVFPKLWNQFTNHNWMRTRTILAANNVTVDDLNVKLLKQLQDERHSYNCIDAVINAFETVNYQVEFLNSQTQADFPHSQFCSTSGAAMKLDL